MIRPADVAWLTLAAAVAIYEAAAKEGELLSEAVDRYRRHHPVLTDGVVVYVAAHLLRRWPPRIDPLHRLARRLGR